MNTTNTVTPIQEASPSAQFAITLGNTLLREKVKDWSDMDSTGEFCKQHGLKLDGEIPGPTQLEVILRNVLGPSGEFYAPGINLDGYDRPRGWERPFQIRAYHYHPVQQTELMESASTEVAEEMAPVPEVAKLGYKVSISLPSHSSSL